MFFKGSLVHVAALYGCNASLQFLLGGDARAALMQFAASTHPENQV
jgi:hypothetical protein